MKRLVFLPLLALALPVVTLRADDIALGDLLSRLDALAGLSHVEDVGGFRFVPPRPPEPPPRTLAEAIERFRRHAYRRKGESLRLYGVRTVADAGGGTEWLFTCESCRWTAVSTAAPPKKSSTGRRSSSSSPMPPKSPTSRR